jgi:predicted TPR repeat methyltransferase
MADNLQRFETATALTAEGRAADAAKLYREILKDQPTHLAAAQALADLVESGAASGDAAEDRRRVCAIEAESAYKVARTALMAGRYDVAKRCYLKVLDLDPDHGDAIWGLAESCYGNDDVAESLHWYRAYLDRYPGDAEARHMVAALGDGPKPSRASDAYVRETFDHFAEDFDRQLLDDLAYRAPKLIHDLFLYACPEPHEGLDILDAGCGTGLSGVDFRDHARRLVGVDLSTEMLKRAKERGIYDELIEDEISACFHARPQDFDLIVAADVFCYIGNLSGTLAAAAVALRPGGHLVFSVESQAKRGYSLTGSGRYAHKPAYVGKAAAAAGFREVKGIEDSLRTEYGEPVRGYITLLERL